MRISPKDWKKVQFEWFRKSTLKVPLVVASEDSPGDFWKDLQTYDGKPESIPEVPIPTQIEKIRAQAILGDGKITIDTSKPGHPLWIKVSYHPDWRITEGAGELYLASPAFMLLVPKTSRVVLTFDTGTGIYLWGKILSLSHRPGIHTQCPADPDHPLDPFLRMTGDGFSERERVPAAKTPTGSQSPLPRPTKIGTNARFFAAFALYGRYHPGSNIDAEIIVTRFFYTTLQPANSKGIKRQIPAPAGGRLRPHPIFAIHPRPCRYLTFWMNASENSAIPRYSTIACCTRRRVMSAWKRWE